MRLIVMTQPTFFVEEDKILTSLFDEGLDNLHLWKPGATRLFTERLLTLIDEDFHSKITIHELFSLKAEYGLKGIHIDNVMAAVPEGYRGRLTKTCNTIDELREAKRHCDYVFLNDTFCSSHTTQQLEEASRRGIIDKKVYAFGGINEDTIRAAHDIGFGGVVVREDLWNRFNIHKESDYKALMQHFDRLRRLTS